ncbi:Fatty acid synthase [Halotydeus destructor]|nr:Fatty acid synthase [Halotydeus destructor]
MAASLRGIPAFDRSIERSCNILEEVNVDLKTMVYDEKTRVSGFVQTAVGMVAVDMALIDSLYAMGLKPDHIVGHSLGEVGAAYADGATDARQTLLSAYRAACVVHKKHGGQSALAFVGLSRAEAKRRCPPGVHVACSNGAQNVAIAGLEADAKPFFRLLEAEGILVIPVETGGLPVHTPIIEDTRRDIAAACDPLYPEPKKRSSSFLSTSFPQEHWSKMSPYVDGKFYADVLINETFFYEVTCLIPQDAVVVEAGPDSVLVKMMKRDVSPDVTLVPLLQANNNDQNLDLFISSLAQIHNSGHRLDIQKLFTE